VHRGGPARAAVTDGAIALRALAYWLAFPGAAIAAHLLARATGHEGFLGRVLVWLVVIPVFLSASFLGSGALAALLAASCAIACLEIVRLIGVARPWPSFALAAAVSLPWLLPALPMLFPLPIVARLAALLPALAYPTLSPGARARWGAPLLALGLGAALSFWLELRRLPGGFGQVLFAFSVVVVNDMISFLAGRMLGGWRPFPVLSPGKTLAGYGFGAAAAVGTGWTLAFAVPGLGPTALTLAALLLAVWGALGDLFVSAVKRRHGAKDAGTFLGPMGGMLDRLDSLVGAGWAYFVLLRLAPW